MNLHAHRHRHERGLFRGLWHFHAHAHLAEPPRPAGLTSPSRPSSGPHAHSHARGSASRYSTAVLTSRAG